MSKKTKVILIAGFGAVSLIVIWLVSAWMVSIIFKTDFSVSDKRVYIIAVSFIGILAVMFLLNHTTRVGKKVIAINQGLEDAHWMTWPEMKKKGLTITKLSKLHEVKDGVPLYAEKNGKDIDVVMAKTIHTLTIGTTGSGKTTTFVDPTIQILSRCKTKPGLVITDPKGELYTHHANTLREQGYNIMLIDLVDPFRSTRWNPFNDVWKKTDKIFSTKESWSRGKYELDGRSFETYEKAEMELKVFIQSLTSEIFVDIQDLIYTTCPIENKNDSTWQKGARDLILALALGFWEDVRDGLMTRKQFNLFNLAQNISQYCTGEFETFKEYFNNRDEFSKTKNFGNTVLVSQDKTLTSYLGDVNSYFAWMADIGVSALTSSNDIELSEFDERPNALFLKIPDEKENRHKLITLFITQMYKALVEKAADNERCGKTKDKELLRNIYFLMDEFGNMPKFLNVKNILTVGRSRKLFMLPVIQDFKQLEDKYGKEEAGIIKSNCDIKVFIRAGDQDTTKEFSELCGKHKVKNISFSEGKELSISTRAESVPLIYPSELQTLNDASAGVDYMGDAIVLAGGKSPLRAKYTPMFDASDIYKNTDIHEPLKEPVFFDEADYYYDIAKRNPYMEELNRLESEVDAFAEDLLKQLENEPETEFDYDENKEVVQRVKHLYMSLEAKITAKLKRWLPESEFKELMRIDIISKLEYLDKLINTAIEKKNNFLTFDLTFIKNYIEKTCLPEYPDMQGLSS